MANPTGKGGRRFQPGQSGNPGGRPKTPEHLKKIRELRPEEVKLLLAKYARMTKRELASAAQDDTTPAIELIIASIVVDAIKKSDAQKLNFILDRSIGKVVEKTEIELPEPVIIKRASGEEIYLSAERPKD
jgi:hypothetical protein